MIPLVSFLVDTKTKFRPRSLAPNKILFLNSRLLCSEHPNLAFSWYFSRVRTHITGMSLGWSIRILRQHATTHTTRECSTISWDVNLNVKWLKVLKDRVITEYLSIVYASTCSLTSNDKFINNFMEKVYIYTLFKLLSHCQCLSLKY